MAHRDDVAFFAVAPGHEVAGGHDHLVIRYVKAADAEASIRKFQSLTGYGIVSVKVVLFTYNVFEFLTGVEYVVSFHLEVFGIKVFSGDELFFFCLRIIDEERMSLAGYESSAVAPDRDLFDNMVIFPVVPVFFCQIVGPVPVGKDHQNESSVLQRLEIFYFSFDGESRAGFTTIERKPVDVCFEFMILGLIVLGSFCK